jgi:multiple sugar transport system permease protein
MSAIMLQVIWTTAGTFMLMFIAGLQDLPTEVEEAAMVDGANRWQRFRAVTLPHLRPTILLVVTLGMIGTWQVFDQMYVMTQGEGAAMAFLLFMLIFVLTSVQRFWLRDKDVARERKAERAQRRAAKKAVKA